MCPRPVPCRVMALSAAAMLLRGVRRGYVRYFASKHGLEVTMISSGVSILYSFFTNAKKLKERMPLPMSQLVTEVSKIEFKPKQV